MKKKERRSEKHRHLCVLLRWAVAEVITMVAVSCCRELDSVPPEVVSTQSCPTLCNPMNRSTPGLPVHHQLPESLRLTSIESAKLHLLHWQVGSLSLGLPGKPLI